MKPKVTKKSEFQQYYDQFRQFTLFDAEEERRLLIAIKGGDNAARDKFVLHNMRLVLSCVLRFVDSNDLKAMDLVSAGTLGLIKAIEDFQVSKENRFSTYAVWWIQAKIRKQLHAIQPKIHKHRNLHVKFRAERNKLHEILGRAPEIEEVFQALGWDYETIVLFSTDVERQIIPLEKIEMIVESGHLIDDALVEDGDLAAKALLIGEDTQRLYKALQTLPPELEDIIRRHYGLGYSRSETYDELAGFYGYTRERIRQLENKGLRLLWLALREKSGPLLSHQNL